MKRGGSRHESITAGELMAKLERDPEYLERVRLKEEARRDRIRFNRRAAAPILDELREAGYEVDSVSELFNRRLNYSSAIPILLKWLPRVSNMDIKEAVVRALSVKWAKPHAAEALVREFRHTPKDAEGLRWAIANGLEVVADDGVLDDVVELVKDPASGRAREMLAMALGNMKDPRAVDVLIGLLQDEVVPGHAIIALRRLNAKRALPDIEPYVSHPLTWIRNEAKKAVAKLSRT